MNFKRFFLFLLTLFIFQSISTFASPLNRADTIKHVVYVTLDGTRWQDVLVTRTHFPKLWANHSAELTVYGIPNSYASIEVASVPISLPSYQSQMSGKVGPCQDNRCGRIQVETLPEKLIRTQKLAKQDVAVFSSWPTIDNAAERKTGTLYASTGDAPVVDPVTQQPDDVMQQINDEQKKHHPGDHIRYDKYTFAQALHYLEKYKPVFLWISLNDADSEAHEGNEHAYHKTLSAYDEDLDTLFNTLKTLQMDNDTLVIITTDHGRGDGDNWTEHGPLYPESKATWAFVKNGMLAQDPSKPDGSYYSTLSIRPTIEQALQLSE